MTEPPKAARKMSLTCDVSGANAAKVNPRPRSGSRSPTKLFAAMRISSPLSSPRARARAQSALGLLPASPSNRGLLMNMFHLDPTNELQRACLAPLEAVLHEERTAEEIESEPDVCSQFRMLRFVRGLKFQNVPESVKLYRAMLVWRKEMGVDKIRKRIVDENLTPKDFPNHDRIMQAYPASVHYADTIDARPVHIDQLGRLNPKKMLSSVTPEDVVQHQLYVVEYNAMMLDRLSQEQGKMVRLVSVFDLSGLGMAILHKGMMDVFKKTLKLTQDYYPETMDQCFIINAPTVFSACWAIVKPLLAERTVQKVKILGKEYKSTLIKNLGAQSIPDSYGGENTREVYDSSESTDDKVVYTEQVVDRGAIAYVYKEVQAGVKVMWGVQTSGSGDIAVELKLMDAVTEEEARSETASERSVLVEEKRTDASSGCVETVEFEKPGVLRLSLSNSTSWLKGKTIMYYLDISDPSK